MSEITILVVDDDDANRYYKAHILGRQGYHIVEAVRGAEAMKLVEAQDPALVLLDVKLPDISGHDVCRQIKKQRPNTIVLQTSAAFTMGTDRAAGLVGGADSYLIEPIEPDELIATVTALLRLQQAERELRVLNESLEQRVDKRTRELVDANQRLAAEMDQRAKAEEALRHAQKLDALGRLTGGIAHDFNNLLTVVIANLELVQIELGAIAAPATKRVGRLIAGAHRAAVDCEHLTQQLLAFARRDVQQFDVVNVNTVITGFDNLLRGALGENVAITLALDSDVWPCSIDKSQFVAAILNLAVNARQAMPKGGEFKVVTRRAEINADAAKNFRSAIIATDLSPGEYVTVSLSDTGCGMSDDVLSRAFEPFFTTKNIGEGSGLGLSQVYGFARKSGGHVTVDTTIAVGTTVTLYLPRSRATVPPRAAGDETLEQLPGGDDTILIVEDNELVLNMAADMIGNLGYRILTAPDANAALDIIAHGKPFDLLFSDVAMPNKMNGIVLAREARRLRPGLRVLLTTGYALLDGDAKAAACEFSFIMKPYRRSDLARRIREALER